MVILSNLRGTQYFTLTLNRGGGNWWKIRGGRLQFNNMHFVVKYPIRANVCKKSSLFAVSHKG